METESGQSNNRLFVLLAVAMIGLICIGLMGLAGVTYFTISGRAQQEEVAELPTPTPIPPTPTLTATPTQTPTETPPPTPTATLVIPVNGGDETGGEVPTLEATPTPTPAPGTRILEGAPPTPPADLAASATPVPATGMPGSGGVLSVGNGLLGWTGVGLLLLLILGVANHFKIFSGKS